ncbi:MAG: MFS transporter [Spirochaetes bacterium]|nr:MFS transporter [Spirochaetota bacterium]
MKKRQNQAVYFIACYAVWGIFWGAWGILLPEIKLMTGISDGTLGKILIGISIGALLSMLGTGMVLKKFSKWVLTGSLLFFALSIATLCLVKSPVFLLIVLFFIGSSSGALDVIMNSGVAVLEAQTGKKYFHIAHSAFPIAVIITSPTVGMARQLGIDFKIIVLVIFFIISMIALFSFNLHMTGKQSGESNQSEIKGRTFQWSVTKGVIIMGILGLLIHFMENSIEQWSAIYLEQRLFTTPGIASLGLTGYMALLFLGRIIANSSKASEKVILIISAILTILGFSLAYLSTNQIVVIFAFSLAGLGISPIIPSIFSQIGRTTSPEIRMKAISTVTMIAYAGYLLCPPLVGWIAEIKTLRFAWLLMTILGLIALVIILFNKELKKNV